MKRLICAIIILVGVYAVSSDARESRVVPGMENTYTVYDTVYTIFKIDTLGRELPESEWKEGFTISFRPPQEYLHTDIKIFHGPTAQSVLDYFRAWEDSVDVEIVGSVDMEMQQPYSYMDWVEIREDGLSEMQQVKQNAIYYLTVTYREWREETR